MNNLEDILPSTTDDTLLDELGTADIFRFSRVCVAAKAKVDSYIARTYTIERILLRFFSYLYAIEFRLLMRSTGMIISGSSALQLFDRTIYDKSDLDLFVNRLHAATVAEWLMARGYNFYLTEEQMDKHVTYSFLTNDKPFHGEDCFTFSSMEHSYTEFSVLNFKAQNSDRKIQVIVTADSPLSVVINFHSTVVFNVITSSKAYCLFPRATLIERLNLLNSGRLQVVGMSPATSPALKKYVSRGWTFISNLSNRDALNLRSIFPEGIRQLGDSKCWTITFDPLSSDRTGSKDPYPLRGIDDYLEQDAWLSSTGTYYRFCNNSYIFRSERLARSYMLPTSLNIADVLEIFRKMKEENEGSKYLDYFIDKIFRRPSSPSLTT